MVSAKLLLILFVLLMHIMFYDIAFTIYYSMCGIFEYRKTVFNPHEKHFFNCCQFSFLKAIDRQASFHRKPLITSLMQTWAIDCMNIDWSIKRWLYNVAPGRSNTINAHLDGKFKSYLVCKRQLSVVCIRQLAALHILSNLRWGSL